MKQTILFLAPVDHFKGGAERSLFDLMRNPAIRPVLATPGEGPLAVAARAEGVETVIIPFGEVATITRPVRPTMVLRGLRDWWRAADRLRTAARTAGAEVVHSNGLKAHCIAVLAQQLGGAKAIVHIRDIAVTAAERSFWRLLGRAATRIILVSRACWPDAKLADCASIIHNGVDPPPTVPHFRGSGRLQIGFCGRLHPFKGVHVLLQWFAEALAHGVDADLLIRGEAAREAADYPTRLKVQAETLGIADRVQFQGKFDGLEAIYGGLDLVVVPSDTPDPLPRTVMEAMALGMPVIGYPAGGIPDMIASGKNGWLAASSEDFIAAVAQIRDDPEKLARVSAAARETIATRFSLDAMYVRLNSLYAEVLNPA